MFDLMYLEEKIDESPLSYDEIAEKLGISRTMLYHYRYGTRNIPSYRIGQLAKILNLDIGRLYMQEKEKLPLEATVEEYCGTSRQVADRARTTIGLDKGDKEVSDSYMRKLYLCEHSPIRTQMYIIKFVNLPYWVSVHLSRHNVGVTHFVSTQRTDRTGTTQRGEQDAPVTHEMVLNDQAIINISRKRLCACASKETREAWQEAINKLAEINQPLARCCVPDCVYRGHCYEHKSCGFHKTNKFLGAIDKYREGINE